MKGGLGLSQAFRTLSIIPLKGPDAKNCSSSLYFYPFVGLILGLLATVIPYLLIKFLNANSLVCGLLYTLMMVFLTRGFHLDGLGDTCDGFGGSFEKEKILEIMSDSRSGSFSVIAISLVLISKTITSSILFSQLDFISIIIAVLFSRCFVVILCVVGSYAKEYGLSYDLVKNANKKHLLLSLAYIVISFFLLYLLEEKLLKTLVMFISGLIAMVVLYCISKKKIGGITGDILGSCVEITETAMLVASCLI